jgi:hypothetical protein
MEKHNKIDKAHGKGQQKRTKTKWVCKKFNIYRTLYKIILKTPNVEIPKRNFFLLNNPIVFFNRIFRG